MHNSNLCYQFNSFLFYSNFFLSVCVQIAKMIEKLQLASTLLKRCPSCLHNFLQNVCDLTCDPNQSHFMKPQGFDKTNTSKGKFWIILLFTFSYSFGRTLILFPKTSKSFRFERSIRATVRLNLKFEFQTQTFELGIMFKRIWIKFFFE